jgi:tetratricopeptide (TPR) repeat protein
MLTFCRGGGVLILMAARLAFTQTPADDVRLIAAALRAKEYDRALQLARSVLRQAPEDPRILTLEGMALSGLDKRSEALSAFGRALRIRPDYVPALEGAAELEYKAGSARAIPLLNRLLKLHPDDPTSHAMLAVMDYKQGDCAAAVEHFRRSASVSASQPAALEEFGGCLVKLKKPAEAVPVFQQLVALRPEDRRARYKLAAIQVMARHEREAIETLQPLLDGARPDPGALDLAATAYEAAGDVPRAVSSLRQAILLAPRNVDYYLDFTSLCFTHGSFQVGIDVIDAGLSRMPDAAPLYLARGILLIQLGQYDKGESDFETADRLDPKQAFSSVAEGLAQLQESNLDRALATVRAKLSRHPDDAFLNYLLAEILARQGAQPGTPQFRQAVAAASRAVQLKPDLALARETLGRLYTASGQLDKAIQQYRLALRSNPSDQVALYRLALALRKTGDREEVPALLKRLALLREQSRRQEAEESRYKLVEQVGASEH